MFACLIGWILYLILYDIVFCGKSFSPNLFFSFFVSPLMSSCTHLLLSSLLYIKI